MADRQMTIDDALLIIEKQAAELKKKERLLERKTRELDELKGNRPRRPLSDCWPDEIREKYPVAYAKLGSNDRANLTREIREVCFPRSKTRTRSVDSIKAPAILSVYEMDDDQFVVYYRVLERILSILDEDAYVGEEDIKFLERWYPERVKDYAER